MNIMENYKRCEGCDCFYYNVKDVIDKRICILIRRRYYKYISEKCPCQTCLVKVTCLHHSISRITLSKNFCEKLYRYFNNTFKYGIVIRKDGRRKDFIVRKKVKERFKLKEIKQ